MKGILRSWWVLLTCMIPFAVCLFYCIQRYFAGENYYIEFIIALVTSLAIWFCGNWSSIVCVFFTGPEDDLNTMGGGSSCRTGIVYANGHSYWITYFI